MIEEQVNQEDLGDDVSGDDVTGVKVPNDKVPGDNVPGDEVPGDDEVPGQVETVEEPTDELLGYVEEHDTAAEKRHEQLGELKDALHSYYE